MKTELEAFLKAHRELRNAAEAIALAWSADEKYRNRPDRQKLTQKLMKSLPDQMAIGDVAFAVADSCEVSI